MNIWKKYLFFNLALLLISNASFSQKIENRIYVLDGTASMDGYKDSPKIWPDVKEKLLHNVEDINENQTDVVLVIFSTGIDFTISGKDRIINFIKNFSPKGMNTNILAGWDKAIQLINPNQYNFITLLTDGKDNVSDKTGAILNSRFRDWCNLSTRVNAFACIVRLTADAQDSNMANAINSSCNIKYIDGIKFPSFIQVQKQDVSFNLRGGYNKKDIDLYVNVINERDLPDSTAIQLTLENSPFLELIRNNTEFRKGNGSIPISLRRKPGVQMKDSVQPFDIKLIANKNDVIIVNESVKGEILNYPQPELNVNINPNLGKKNHYDKFLFSKGKNDPFEQEIELSWNEDAKNKNSNTELVVDFDNIPQNRYSIFLNGNKIEGNKIKLSTNEAKAKLGILIDPSVEDGKYNGKIYTSSHNLSKSNLENPIISELKYTESWNPLKIFLAWTMIVLITILIVWLIFLKRIFYPVFSAMSITVQSPYFKSINLKNSRTIIFTQKIQKQTFLSKFLKGKIIYENNPAWTSDWIVSPKNRNQIKPKFGPDYSIEPFSTSLQKFNQYEIWNLNKQPKEKVEITIN